MLSHHPIFVIFVVAVTAPLLAQTRLGSRVPVVVIEVLLGVLIGPHVLQLIENDAFLATMRSVGMVAVMFMAGMEIDFNRIKGKPLSLAASGWLSSVVLAVLVVGVLHVIPDVQAPMMVVIALTTTGLGTLLPILRDSGQLEAPFGRMLLAAGTLGEVGPIVAVSLALSSRYSTWQEFLFLLVFLGLVGLAAAVGVGARPPKVIALLSRTMHASTQLPVRLSLMILGGLVLIANEFGFEAVFGAFAAGMIVGLATRGPDGEAFRLKIDAVCFGWFAPFFYVGTGIAFDIGALTRDLPTMLLLPSFLVLFLLVRGLPVLLYRRELAKPELLPFALSMSVTSLGLVVVITHVGLQTNHMSPDIARALVGAALLSLLVYPTLSRILLSRVQAVDSPIKQD
ncbi:MAG: cation:proton antiporter [Dechloromonas sp.]|nr:cation:proton antiporter [Dechloromonas sp.]